MSRNKYRFVPFLTYAFFFLANFICTTTASYAQQLLSSPGGTGAAYTQEKVFVHTDKDFYLAGEIAWFRIYCVDQGSHRPMNTSKVAYVEIIDHQQKSVLQAKVELTKDGGNGSFYLPLTLNSGAYVLRAYTNWMKNLGSEFFFEKKLSIINTIKNSTATGTAQKPTSSLRFFPEGGNMISGLPGKVAFHLVDSLGRGIDARGFLVDNSGDTLLEFSPGRFGMGSFNLTPEEGKSYKASILLPGGRMIQQPLPPAGQLGYTMSVTDIEVEKIRITMRGRFAPPEAGKSLTLVAHSRRKEHSVQKGYLGAGSELSWIVDEKELTDGVNILTVFDEAGQPVSERLVFVRPSARAQFFASTSREVYGQRERIDLKLSPVEGGESAPYNCSVAVYLADSSWNNDQEGIDEYLLLTSELSGEIESPGYYFSGDAGVDAAIDNLMLTHGWRRFRKQEKNQGAYVRFLPEANGHLVSARVTQSLTGRPAAGIDCYLSVPSYPFGFYTGQSDSMGIVRFDVRNYYGPGEVIAQVAVPDREKYRIDILGPFSELPAKTPLFGELPPFNPARLLDRSIAMQAQNIYLADSNRKYTVPETIDTMPFFGRAEYTYDLEEYKRFTTMEEVLREYVMPVNVRLQDGKLQMAIFDEVVRQFYTDNILVLLDGIPIYDFNRIFSFDPLKIRKLQVVPRRYLYGARVFSGIASFESMNKSFEGFSLDPSLLAVNYEGLQLQREFYSPVHGAGAAVSKRVPDLRTTLYWQPVFKTGNSQGATFYSSDLKGKFIVVVNGINDDGRPIHATTHFTVQ